MEKTNIDFVAAKASFNSNHFVKVLLYIQIFILSLNEKYSYTLFDSKTEMYLFFSIHFIRPGRTFTIIQSKKHIRP